MATSGTGHGPRLCGARKRQGEGTCGKPAGWGTDHLGEGPCRLHGGSTRTVSKGAHLRLVEAGARELFGKIAPDIVPVNNPLAAYAQFAGEVMAWKQLMASLLEDLKTVGYAADSGEQVRAAVQLYERSMDRTNTVLSSFARLNIDERLAKLSETQSRAVLRAVEAVITHLGASPEQANQARAVAARHLRAVS